MIEVLVRDTRYALRLFRRTPLLTATVILVMALALGVNTAVFSIVDEVLLEPLPYPNSEQLALVSRTVQHAGVRASDEAVDGRTWELVRDRATSTDRAVFSTWPAGVNLASAGFAGSARHVQQQRVGAGFFQVLGVSPLLGREFTTDEDRIGGPPVTILSAELWRGMFGADDTIVGRSIMLRGEPLTVVGVMPDGFRTGVSADVWTPLRPTTAGEGGGENYHVLVRVRDRRAWSQATNEIARAGEERIRELPASHGARVTFGLVPLQQSLTDSLRTPLLVLWAAVGVVLLVATVNLAGLLLAQAAGRTREIATRLALGSGLAAVARQLLIESVLLGLIGGAVGILVGFVALEGLRHLAEGAYDIWRPVSLDARAIAACIGLSVATALACGLAPAIHASNVNVRLLAAIGTRAVAGPSSRWFRQLLVVAQVALGVLLMVAAGLLLRTFSHLNGLDAGFDASQVTIASISLEDARYRTADRVTRLFEETLLQLRQSPGIDSAAISLGVPYQRLLNLGFRHVQQDPASARESTGMTNATYVTPGFFQAMRIPILRGRALQENDRGGSPPVVVVSHAFARAYFGESDPIGRRIVLAGAERQVVGVAGDVQVKPGWGNHGPLSAMPLAYLSVGQVSDGFMRLVHGWFPPTIIVRSSLNPAETTTMLRHAIETVDPLLPFAQVRAMSEVRSASLAPQRFLMSLLVGLAALAVLLTAVGIHGLIARSVTERTREMGIRLALGATQAQAMRTLAGPGIVLAAVGTIAGLAGALASGRLLQSFIWSVSAADPLTFAGVVLLILLVAATASVAPALRILTLDPASTLRTE